MYFGADPLEDKRSLIGTAVSTDPKHWSLTMDKVDVDGTEYSDFASSIAFLQSGNEYLEVPSDVHTQFTTLLKAKGFFCPSSTGVCAITGSCDAVANGLPELDLTFTDGTNTFLITITSEVYLLEDISNSQCTTLIQENTSNDYGFALGDPFFRNATVMLDFEDKSITLYLKYVDTPIVPEVWPVPDKSLRTAVEMNVTDEVTYSGNMTVGVESLGIQGADSISYNTRLTYSIVPSTVVKSCGWFDTTGYDGYIDSQESWVVDLGYWSGECSNMTVDVCIDGDLCVSNLEFCLLLVSVETPPAETQGVIGLGKPTGTLQSGQIDSFV